MKNPLATALRACLLGAFGAYGVFGLIGLAGGSGATPPPQLVPLAAAASDTPAMMADWMIAADAERAALAARVTALEAGSPPAPPVTGWVRTEGDGFTDWEHAGWTPTEDDQKLTLILAPRGKVVRADIEIDYTAPEDWKALSSLGWVVGPKWGRDLVVNALAIRKQGPRLKLNSSESSPKIGRLDPKKITIIWEPGQVSEAGGMLLPSLTSWPPRSTFNIGHDSEPELPEEPRSYGWTFEVRIRLEYGP